MSSILYIDTCRACMRKTNGMKCIFNSEVNAVPVAQMLSLTTPLVIRPDDALPNTICSECLSNLINFYKFQQMCIESDIKFRSNNCEVGKSSTNGSYNNDKSNLKASKPTKNTSSNPQVGDGVSNYSVANKLKNFKPYDPVSVVEVSDDEDVVLKFECEDASVYFGSDVETSDSIDDYDQFDKLPIIDVKSIPLDTAGGDQHPSSSKSTKHDFTLMKKQRAIYNCKQCERNFTRKDELENHLQLHIAIKRNSVVEAQQPKLVPQITPAFSNNKRILDMMTQQNIGVKSQPPVLKPIKLKQSLGEFTSKSSVLMPQFPSIASVHQKVEILCETNTLNNQPCVDVEREIKVERSPTGSPIKLAYICNICKLAFARQERLAAHKKMHEQIGNIKTDVMAQGHGKNMFECKSCQKVCITSEEYQRHECISAKVSNENLFSKNTSFEDQKLYNCNICKKVFKTWDGLTEHIGEHQVKILYGTEPGSGNVITESDNTEEIGKHECESCKESFKSLEELSEHSKEHAEKQEKNEDVEMCECLLCQSGLEAKPYPPNEDPLENPLEENEIVKVNIDKCNYCGLILDNYQNLLHHVRMCHGTEESNNPSSSRPINGLTEAYKIIQLFECDVCGKSFDRQDHFVRHKKTHEKKNKMLKPTADNAGISTYEDKASCMCEICGVMISTRANLVRHLIRVHHVDRNDINFEETKKKSAKLKPFKCKICRRFFTKQHNLVQHLVVHKKNESQTFEKDNKNLEVSEVKQNGENYECKICNNMFTDYNELEQHRLHHNNDCLDDNDVKPTPQELGECVEAPSVLDVQYKETFNCTKCSRQFDHKHILDHHMQTHSNKSFVLGSKHCKICKRKYTTRYILERHIKTVHANHPSVNCNLGKNEGTKILHKCNTCKRQFGSISNLKTHQRIHEKPELFPEPATMGATKMGKELPIPSCSPHKCLECKLIVSTRPSLLRHIMRKHRNKYFPIDPKRYKIQCKMCTRPFNRMCDLSMHSRAHVVKTTWKKFDYRQYECDICPSKCMSIWNVRRHLREVHGINADEANKRVAKLACKICNTYVTGNKHLTKHIQREHKKSTATSKEVTKKIFKCKTCRKRFKTSKEFRLHLKDHKVAKENNHFTTSFESAPLLEEDWPKCELCSKAFPHPYRLKMHMVKKHRISK